MARLQPDADARGELEWLLHFIDSSISRGGFSTKLHLRTHGSGRPRLVVVSGGERHESQFVPVLLERGKVKRVGRGRPRLSPRRVVGDKGFSYRPVRAYVPRRRIGAVS